MSTKDNGGPAFPAHHFDMAENEHGLTMRDYFAAKAMQSWITAALQADAGEKSPGMSDFTMTWISDYSYVMADEMLRAREAA